MSDQTPDSTAVSPTPVAQASDAGTPTAANTPSAVPPTTAPTVAQAVDPVANDGNGPQPLDTSNGVVATPMDPNNPDNQPQTDLKSSSQPIPLQPYTAAPPDDIHQPPPAHPLVHRLLATARAFSQGLAGGPMYQTRIDNTGKTVRVEMPLSGGAIAKAIALEALTGGLAGAGEHGPNAVGAAAAKGLEQGEKIADQRRSVQEQADQKAQQDYIRQFEAFKTNVQTLQSMQAAGKHDFDMANSPVELNKNWMDWLRENDPGKIGDPDVSEQESMNVQDFPAHEYFRVPIATYPVVDPNTGRPVWQDIHGRDVPEGTPFAHARYEHRYAMVHRDADTPVHGADGEIDPGLQKQMDQGLQPSQLADAGQGTKIPASSYLSGNARSTTLSAFQNFVNAPNGLVSQVNHYRQLVAASKDNAAPNMIDPDKDSIWDLFGGNTDKIADFVEQHEGKTQADGSPSRSVRDNNPGNLVANASWTGPVDDKNLPPGQAPFRVYGSYQEGKDALEQQVLKWKKENPNQSISSFFNRYTTPGKTGPDGLNDQQRYIQAALRANGASDVNRDLAGLMKPISGFDDAVKNTPGAERAVTAFMRGLNSPNNKNASAQVALDNMKDQRQRAFVIHLLGDDPNAAVDYDSNRHNQGVQLMEMSRNQAKLKYNDDKRQQEENAIIARNENTIQAMAKGATVDPTTILTMRAYDREIVMNELEKRTGGLYDLSSVRNIINLKNAITDTFTAGSFGNQVANINTAWGHTSAANEDLKQLQRMVPGLMENSDLLGKPLSYVAQHLEGVNPEAAHMYTQYLADLHTATTDWQNLLNNQHALQESDKEMAEKVISNTASFGDAHAALQGMMRNATNRVVPLDERYGDVMSRSPKERVHYPNMIQPQTVEAIRKMNDPEVMQKVAHFESGGTITGQTIDPKTGNYSVGQRGKEVGLMLTPAAPQQGAKPDSNVLQQYVRVYGANKAEVQRAMQANGWNTQF